MFPLRKAVKEVDVFDYWNIRQGTEIEFGTYWNVPTGNNTDDGQSELKEKLVWRKAIVDFCNEETLIYSYPGDDNYMDETTGRSYGDSVSVQEIINGNAFIREVKK